MKRMIAFTIAAVLCFSLFSGAPCLVNAYTQGYDGMGPVVISGGQRDFKWPVPGNYNLQSCFYDHRNHCAIDISASKGTAVVASYSGTVVATYSGCTHNYSKSSSCCNDGFGNYVVLRHSYTKSDGSIIELFSRYSHLTAVNVSNGQSVSKGTTVGTVGSTGYSSGFHLDFQILYGNWKPYQTYSIDPYANQLLELPANLQVYDSWDCGKSYYELVKQLYSATVTISFNANGGSCSTSQRTITPGSAIGTLPTPTRSGYEFAGWYYDKAASYDDPVSSSTTFSSATTLYAHWASQLYKGNKITFDAQGGQLPGASASRTIDGYNVGRGGNELIVYNCAGNTVNTNSYGVEVAVNSEGKVTAKRAYGSTSTLTVPSGGFVLSGHVDASSSGGNFVAAIEVGNYVAYNKSANKAYVYTSKNAYLANQKYVSSGSAYGELPTPTNGSKAFQGWYTATSGGTKITSSSTYSVSTLYAHWDSGRKYYIGMNACIDGEYADTTKDYGTADVYINGKLVADDVTDYFTYWPAGTTYEFKDIKPAAGCSYNGIHKGSRKGVVENDNISVEFDFTKFDANSFNGVGEVHYHNRHKYLYFASRLTWYEANEYCKSIGGHLVTITDSAEDEFVRSMFESGTYVWIGATDETHEGEWTWVTGEAFNYSLWGAPNPDNAETDGIDGEDFAHYNNESNWNDIYGYMKCAFVCEFEECDHSYSSSVIAPTCTADGYTVYSCDCGNSYTGNTVPALGHAWDNGTVTTPPTATETGTRTYTCTRCAAITTEVIPATGEDKPCDGGADCPSAKFKDVKASDWFHEYVDFAVSHGLFGGMSANTFEPNTAMTRAMLVTVLWRYAGKPNEGTNNFTDVKSDQWYTNAVAWAAHNGIVGGVGNNKFDPNGNVTREQMAAILYRYANSNGIDTSARADMNSFPDGNKVSSYANDAIRWAVAEGLINGSDGKLMPQGNATRAQVAAILMRFIENVVSK